MPLTDHDLIFLALTTFAAFVGARLASRGKSDAAGIARLEQKIESIQVHLGLTGYDVPSANAPTALVGNAYPGTATPTGEEVINELRRGRKIEAIRIYRDQHKVGLKDAKDAVDRIEQTLR